MLFRRRAAIGSPASCASSGSLAIPGPGKAGVLSTPATRSRAARIRSEVSSRLLHVRHPVRDLSAPRDSATLKGERRKELIVLNADGRGRCAPPKSTPKARRRRRRRSHVPSPDPDGRRSALFLIAGAYRLLFGAVGLHHSTCASSPKTGHSSDAVESNSTDWILKKISKRSLEAKSFLRRGLSDLHNVSPWHSSCPHPSARIAPLCC